MKPGDSPPPAPSPAGTPAQAERQALRARLLAARESMPDHAERERVLVARVARWLRTMPVARLAFYWPIRGEPNLVSTIASWIAEAPNRQASLPVIAGRALEFAPWTPRSPMTTGPFGIQAPATSNRITPQLLLIPCVAIDARRYRLGFGGGYYDRTLAALSLKPVTVGVAFDIGRVPSIQPGPHDVRLDLAITESGVL
jgi:5,10-methenyltetrahydrofolate synthetase